MATPRHPKGELGDWSFLPIAIRAWTEPTEASWSDRNREPKLPKHLLVFDTETTIDETQALNFGAWRYYRVAATTDSLDLTYVDEGLFFADDLRERDPDGYDTLVRYQADHWPDVDPTVTDASYNLRLISQRQFVDDVLLKAAFELRAWVVGFNLPFDLSRVATLRDRIGLPGMKILQFAFDEDDAHPFLPHNYPELCVAYTGTHDNDTVIGWYESAPEHERDWARRYLSWDGSDPAGRFIETVWASRAMYAVAPLQDFLRLGPAGRMNTPGIAGGNWQWRIPPGSDLRAVAEELGALNARYDR